MEEVAAQMAQTMSQLGNGMIPVSTLYIGLNALIMFILSILVVRARMQTGVEVGDGGREELIKAQRAHGNNVEYVPISLLILIAVELAGAPVWLLHGLGGGLTVARISHGIGMHTSSGRSPGRALGASLSWLVMLAGGLACIYYWFN
ncbi:MAG: uncharacterized protein Dbin4_01103 [Alphaproteobacteria bacterium]|nr:uncharacterized protein [Alphaproteobacteria bacterium]